MATVTMSWQTRMMLMIVGALVAGQALHWFIGGAAANHSGSRNTLVVAQFMVGAVLLFRAWRAQRRFADRK